MAEAKRNAPKTLVTILVGNKCDLDKKRVVSYKEGELFAQEHGMLFIETSAKSSQNVDEAFTTVAKTIYDKIEDGTLDIDEQQVQLNAIATSTIDVDTNRVTKLG